MDGRCPREPEYWTGLTLHSLWEHSLIGYPNGFCVREDVRLVKRFHTLGICDAPSLYIALSLWDTLFYVSGEKCFSSISDARVWWCSGIDFGMQYSWSHAASDLKVRNFVARLLQSGEIKLSSNATTSITEPVLQRTMERRLVFQRHLHRPSNKLILHILVYNYLMASWLQRWQILAVL